MISISTRGKQEQAPSRFVKSQLILFQSRKKFAFLYCLATVTGLFCLPGAFGALSSPGPDFLAIILTILPLPAASLLITAGTYIMNDLVDADLDRANGKKRPIPSGLVSKRQAKVFVALTFGGAVLLTVANFNPIGLLIITLMLAIGIAYSSPKVALMKRFVVKTLSIAGFYILCALLGMTSAYNFDSAIASPILVISVLLTLAIMVFISSTLNDMGDVEGDKAAGRRTIPIVIGKANTIKLTMILAASVLAVTWAFNAVGFVVGQGSTGMAITTTALALVVLITLANMRQGLQDAEFMRAQHKKLFPLQMALHPSLVAGLML
jgi:geranylgeranylglycerol-phosphate geranylgeranyltransferase